MIDLNRVQGLDEELRVDSSEGGARYLLIGEHGGHVRVSASTRQLCRWVRDGLTFEELAARLRQQTGQPLEGKHLENAFVQVMNSLQEADRQAETGPGKSFWFRFRLIPEAWVSRIAARMSFLFDPRVAVGALGVIVMVMGMLTLFGLRLDPSAGDFWSGYLLFVASLIVHEFGHASACSRYGAQPSDIGFTMYLIYPAFYSRVTNAWRLRRWQRVVVDLGGNYFQYLVGVVYVACYLYTGRDMFWVAALMIVYSSAFSLNPIFKFDGYWMMADALGVMNLSQQPKRLLKHLWRALRGQPREPLPWPRWVVAVLLVYTPLSFAFWGYFFSRLLPWVWSMAVSYPQILFAVARDIVTRGQWSSLQQLLIPTFLLLIAGVLLWRLATPVVRPTAEWVRATLTRRGQAGEPA